MRFAYIDSQGKEVAIPSVDALRLRIALKAIVEDTVFYDSTTDRWAPAQEHEIFRTLSKELGEQEDDQFVAPPPEPSPSVEDQVDEVEDLEVPELEVEDLEPGLTPEDHDDDEWRFDISNAPVDVRGADDEGDEQGAPGDGASVEPLGTSSWLDLDGDEPTEEFDLEGVQFHDDPPGSDDGGEIQLVPELGGPEPESEPEPEPELEPELESQPEPDVDQLPDFVEPTHVSGAETAADPGTEPLAGLSQDRFELDGTLEDAGWGDEPPPPSTVDNSPIEFEGLADDVINEPPARPPSSGTSRGRPDDLPVPSREELAARRTDTAQAGGRAGPRPGPPPRSRSRSRGGAGVLVVVGLLVAAAAAGGWWFMGSGSATDGSEPEPEVPQVAIPDLPTSLEPRMRELADQARSLGLQELGALAEARSLPAEPDRQWLAGIYLANASQYTGVQTYWEEIGRFLRVMQVAEDSLFMVALERELAAAALPSDTAQILEERIVAGFQATARDRGVIFQRARGVSEAALRLHSFLLDNEDSIDYEPGIGGISADPVLEAIPATPQIGETMWDRVGDITDALDALDFLDRVTTERLIEAVILRLSDIPVR